MKLRDPIPDILTVDYKSLILPVWRASSNNLVRKVNEGTIITRSGVKLHIKRATNLYSHPTPISYICRIFGKDWIMKIEFRVDYCAAGYHVESVRVMGAGGRQENIVPDLVMMCLER